MNATAINYGGILWPLPYRAQALKRAHGLRAADAATADLYRRVFDPEHLQLPVIPVDAPLARERDDHIAASQYFARQPDLPLSIVTVTRNDDHVERMDERTQAFIDAIYWLAEKYRRRVELIIVEWNPPAPKPLLAEAFRFPGEHPWVSTSIVTVPAALHDNYQLADQLPLYQMIGKNVGIRRARGDYILATNIDVLLSESLFELITGPTLQPGRIYRGNRWDVDRAILDLDNAEQMLDRARALTFQINYPHATVGRDDAPPPEIPMADYLGYRLLPPLHTMACGDFQLLHRDDWARLRGYCELDTFSFHLDSLFALTCHYAGIEEVNLHNEYPHFHIDHTLGTSVKSDSYVIESTKVMKHISMEGVVNLSRTMELAGDYYIFNKSNWGMAGTALPVTNVTVADWETGTWQPGALSLDDGKGCLDTITLATINIGDKQVEQQCALIHDIAALTAAYLRRRMPGRRLVIWGAGHKAHVFRHYLAANGVEIDTLIDGQRLQATEESGISVVGPEYLHDNRDCFVVIYSMYANDIKQQLDAMHYREGQDYLVGF